MPNTGQQTLLEKNKQLVIYMCLYFAFSVNVVNVLYSNASSRLLLSSLLGVFLVITVIRHIWTRFPSVKYLLPILEAILIFSVNYLDVTNKSQFILIIFIADIVLSYSIGYSITFSIVGYTLLIVNHFMKAEFIDPDEMTQYISVSGITYFSSMVIFSIVKNQMMQNARYKILADELMKKTKEAEELAVFKERTRIAGEIHDTVGHTLTTVLIELEAGRMLIDRDPSLAKEKIGIAKEQVKKGLVSIRSSVRAIKSGEELMSFKDALRALFVEIEKSTGAIVKSHVELQSQLLPIQEKIFYHVIQEALTNGLKHGKATVFHLSITEESGHVYVHIEDNGTGVEDFDMGFGLMNIKERIKSIGGHVKFSSKVHQGFQIDAVIPIGG